MSGEFSEDTNKFIWRDWLWGRPAQERSIIQDLYRYRYYYECARAEADFLRDVPCKCGMVKTEAK